MRTMILSLEYQVHSEVSVSSIPAETQPICIRYSVKL